MRIVDFMKTEFAPGALLILAAIAAICVNNYEITSSLYSKIFLTNLPIKLDFINIHKDLTIKDWINDFFMAIFFFLIGLELKKEVLVGQLSSRSKMLLPFFSACGGVIVPALIYLNINSNEAANLNGWAIPVATDIAFCVAILNLFGNKINKSLKIFLIALAVIDDLFAILIIAIFYGKSPDIYYIDLALITIIILFLLNRFKVKKISPYIIFGLILWLFTLKSGIHATISGVILAFFIPMNSQNHQNSPLHILEDKLKILVEFIILPIFAFANCDINFSALSFENIFENKLIISIILGLFLGKQIGVFFTVYLLHKLKWCNLFKDEDWINVYGVSILTGIGFTMSLFIGNLAFISNKILINEAMVGILIGSILSAIYGFLVIFVNLKFFKRRITR